MSANLVMSLSEVAKCTLAVLPKRTLHIYEHAQAAMQALPALVASGDLVRAFAAADVSGDEDDYRWVIEVYPTEAAQAVTVAARQTWAALSGALRTMPDLLNW